MARDSVIVPEARTIFGTKNIDPHEILSTLRPPKHFHGAEFSNYFPDTRYPSQSEAVGSIQNFIRRSAEKPSLLSYFFSRRDQVGKGLYLDGGFGVGKTHLLAAVYHTYDGSKAYLSFQELMFLVGLLSLNGVVKALGNYQLLVIDEFELDDPANTRITTNLLGQLFDGGVNILTSSNTPPGALGEGKFSVEDFERELGALRSHFTVLRIDGEDYRTAHHLDSSDGSTWGLSDDALDTVSSQRRQADHSVLDSDFKEFLASLATVHPMRVRKALEAIDTIVLRNIVTIGHPHEALRFVYCIDKAYDNNICLFAGSQIGIDDLFDRSYLIGGDTKKYLRTRSRLREMTTNR